jgi:hypothetical protein
MECFLLHAHQAGVEHLLPLLSFKHGIHLPETADRYMVIAWGAVSEDMLSDHALCILNTRENVLRAGHTKTMRKLLQWHGLKVTPAENERVKLNSLLPAYQIEFKIVIFDLSAAAVLVKQRNDRHWSASPLYATDDSHFHELDLTGRIGFYVRRAIREAKKAVYALGLDFAQVNIAIGGNGHTMVMDVDPAPALDPLSAEQFGKAMVQYAAQLKVIRQAFKEQTEPVLLGADPEFILRKSNGRIVSADRFMGREGLVGCDAVVLAGHRVILPLVELRPEPSANPRVLTARIRSAMQRAAVIINDPELEWLAGGMPVKGLPLGGHIHFSGVELNSDLLRTLDNYLALPLVLLEGETTHHRRPRYGFLGDFRRQPHGGFEYRTLPSWLISPHIAAGVLSLACVIANHYRLLRRRPLRNLDMQQAYYQGDKHLILPYVPPLWDDIALTATFKRYESELTYLRDRLLTMEAWPEQADFRSSWEIGPFARKEVTLH